jgi:hypothetical protein
MATLSPAMRGYSGIVSWRLAVAITLCVGALALSSAVATVLLGACVVAALIGPKQAVQALTAATLIAYANTAIVKPGVTEGVLLRLVLIAAVLRVIPMMRGSDLRLVWPAWLFALVEGLTSVQTSPAVVISLMKVVTFGFATTAVLVAYNHVRPTQLAGLQRWMVTVGLTVIGLSGLTLLEPGIGLGGDGGLQGLLNQPQALGIFIAPFAAWAIAGTLLMRRRVTRLEMWVALASIALIILSKARTAGFGAAFGVIAVIMGRALGKRRLGQAALGRAILISALACGGLAAVAVTTGGVSKIITGYLYKGSRDEVQNLDQAFYASRGGGALGQWDSFLDKPLLGNGFGVYPDGHFPAGVDTFEGIPISAPVEKGFLPTAILEEGGILGAALLTVLIASLCRRAWRNSDLRWRAMFIACLAINIGECVFMSPGGIGMFDWLLLSLAMFSYRTESIRRIPAAESPLARHLGGVEDAAPTGIGGTGIEIAL